MMKKTRSQFASTQKMVNSIKGVRERSLMTSHKVRYLSFVTQITLKLMNPITKLLSNPLFYAIDELPSARILETFEIQFFLTARILETFEIQIFSTQMLDKSRYLFNQLNCGQEYLVRFHYKNWAENARIHPKYSSVSGIQRIMGYAQNRMAIEPTHTHQWFFIA